MFFTMMIIVGVVVFLAFMFGVVGIANALGKASDKIKGTDYYKNGERNEVHLFWGIAIWIGVFVLICVAFF